MTNLTTTAFIHICQTFFIKDGLSIPFLVREKRNTQDDPFDEYLVNEGINKIQNINCIKPPEPAFSCQICY